MKPAPPVMSARTRRVLSSEAAVRGSKACTAAATSSTSSSRSPGWSGSDSTSSHTRRGNRAVRPDRARRAPAAAESAPDSESASRCRAPRGAPAASCASRGAGRRTDDRRGRHRARGGTSTGAPGQRRAIARRQRAPPAGPAGEARQPRAQDGRLHLVEPRVDARLLVMVAVGLAAVAQPPDPVGERAIVGDDRAAIAERAEILRRIEAERAGDADRADRPPGGRREVRLAAVFDDRELVRAPRSPRSPPCRPPARRGAPAGSRASAAPMAAAIRVGVDRQAHRIDVGEHRPRAGHHDRRARCRRPTAAS